MAKNNTKQAAQTLPSPDEAYQQLFTSIHQRVFFHKLASVRPEYMPKTPQQAVLQIVDSMKPKER